MKLEARRIITRILKAIDAEFPDGARLDELPELSPGQWRAFAAALASYRATLDEKMVEADLRRPQISLRELSGPELRALCRRREVIDVKEEAG